MQLNIAIIYGLAKFQMKTATKREAFLKRLWLKAVPSAFSLG
jgi:hypothetical protein